MIPLFMVESSFLRPILPVELKPGFPILGTFPPILPQPLQVFHPTLFH